MNRPCLIVLILIATGCSPKGSYTPSSQRTYAPKPADCFVEMFSTAPQRPYEEIGIYDMVTSGDRAVRSAEELRDYLRPRVCQVGGDAIIVAANGNGVYVKAVAIHWSEAAPAPAAASPTAPPPADD